MKRNSILAALLLLLAGLQTAWGQGFRVYKSDGTVAQFSVKSDSIVFYDGAGEDYDLGPFTPVNSLVAGTWYKSHSEVVTFREDGTTDYISGGTYQFLPYQGEVLVYNSAKKLKQILRVHNVTAEELVVSTLGSAGFSVWSATQPPQLVTSITLNETSLGLSPNNAYQLKATVLPEDADNKEVAWKSSDEAVATLPAPGLVLAVGYGTCTITCSAKDGSGVKATCEVRVPKPVTGITVSPATLTLEPGKTQTLTAMVQPEDATDKAVAWKSSKTGVATVDQSGNVTAVAAGECTIIATAKDGSGVKGTCKVTVGNTPDEHEYVDLGLPSGTLWATCNVGASKPEEYGDYFAWGETTPKSTYSWSTYKWCKGSETTMTKYCTMSDYGYNGFTDNLTELQPEDDAATANWGSGWQMPSLDQIKELINDEYTTWKWTQLNGVYGHMVTSDSNGNSIFLPAAGFRGYDDLNFAGRYGNYWSSSLRPYYNYNAFYFYFDSIYWNWNVNFRYYGRSVRAVRVP